MSTATITVESLEALATQLEETEKAKRAKLTRMIAAYCRILAVREPQTFKARATVIADKDGHWDNSYPPKIEWKEKTGPKLHEIAGGDYGTTSTSTGCYHSWDAYTETRGLYVDRSGEIWGAEFAGTGSVGEYAAYPGNHNVEIEIEWSESDEVETAQLEEAEETLRALAFPLAAAAE